MEKTNNKYDIKEIKMSEVEVGNVTWEPHIYVVNAVKKLRYEDGEPVEGSVSKINIEYVDKKIFDVIQKAGADVEALKSDTLEIVSENESLLKQLDEEALIGQILDVSKAKAFLKWQNNQFSAGWQGVKLMIDLNDVKIVGGQTDGK